MNRSFKFNFVSVAAIAMTCAFGGLVACGDDDDATTVTPDAGTSTSSLTLYERLGGKSGLESFVKTVVETKILTDAELKTFFFNQVATPIPANHPSATQIVVCFGRFVGAALMADTYPGAPVNDAANTNTPNFTCRDMVASHKGADTQLNIGSANFDKFIGHIATSLQPLVVASPSKAGEISQAEFDALAAALNGQKGDVTTAGAPSGGVFVKP